MLVEIGRYIGFCVYCTAVGPIQYIWPPVTGAKLKICITEQNDQKRYTSDFLPVCGIKLENQVVIRVYTKPKLDDVFYHGIPFSGKIPMPARPSLKNEKKVIPVYSCQFTVQNMKTR